MHPMTLDRPSQWRFALSIFVIGVCFMFAAVFAPDVMTPAVYGDWAYDVDAEAWAGAFIASSALVLYGLHINGRWRFSPVIRAAGYLSLTALFFSIGVSSFFAENGLHLVIFAWVYFVPQCVRFLRISIVDMRRRLDLGRA